MMNLQRTYIHQKRAWYGATHTFGPGIVDEVSIEVRDGNFLLGEFHIEYHDLQHTKGPAPRLCAFDDGWRALTVLCSDLLEELGERDGDGTPPVELCRVLDHLGFQDATPVVKQ